MSTVAARARGRYRAGRAAWHEFCDGMQIPPRLGPLEEGWGEVWLDFCAWEHRLMGVGYSGLVARYSTIRFAHLIDGCDLSKASFRVRSFVRAIKGLTQLRRKSQRPWSC